MTKTAPEKDPVKDVAQPEQAATEQPKTNKAAVINTDNSKNGYLAARRAARENGAKQ